MNGPALEPALEIVEEIGSTSDALKGRAASGTPGEAALMARRQTAGRGRLGRGWQTIPGNLHLSVLLRPPALRWPGHWSILSAVALADAVREHLPDPALLRLKWPNDLMLGGGKLAGILLEAGTDASPWLVIGFGVNLAGAPDGLGRQTATLGPHAPPPEAFARRLLARLQAWRVRYDAEGFGPVLGAWLRSAHFPGEAVTATVGAGQVAGRFAGLAPDGAMLLDTPSGRVTIPAGEVA